MNKVCKEYINEVKTLFPLKRKQEKEYIKNLSADIEAYCEDANAATKQDLYDNYGKPVEVVNNYVSALDSDYLIKRLRFSKVIRVCATVLIVAAVLALAAHCLNQYQMKKVWDENVVGTYYDTVIVVEEAIE